MGRKRTPPDPRPALNDYLDRPVALLKGIGPAREEILRASGIATFRDLVLLLPRSFRQSAR